MDHFCALSLERTDTYIVSRTLYQYTDSKDNQRSIGECTEMSQPSWVFRSLEEFTCRVSVYYTVSKRFTLHSSGRCYCDPDLVKSIEKTCGLGPDPIVVQHGR